MSAENGKRVVRRAVALLVTTTMLFSSTFFVAPRAQALLSPEELAIRDGLQQVSDALVGLQGLDELAQTLPLSGLLPTDDAGLDVVDSVKAVLDDAIALLDANSVDNALEDALNALDDTSVGAGVTAHVDADVDGDQITFSELSFTRTTTTPLELATPELSLDGASLQTNLSLSFTANGELTMLLDTAGAPELYLPDTAPNAALTAELSLDVDPGLTLDLGILTVNATGGDAGVPDITAATAFAIDWLDPDGDARISLSDLQTAAPLDLFDVSYASSSVDLDLTLSAASSLLTGLSATGTISLHDDNLADGLAAPTVNLPELENFTNMTPEEVLFSIAQLAVSLQSMQTRVANIDLPVIGADPNAAPDAKTVENLADLLDVNAKLGDFFVSNGLSSPESPFELKIGDTDGNGKVEPPEVSLDTLNLDDIDSVIQALATYLGDTTDLSYDPATDSLAFDLTFGATYAPPAAIVALNDQLAELGLKGLVSVDPNATAGIKFESSYNIDVGFGIDLSELPPVPDGESPPPITDRLFIDTSGVEVTGDAKVSGNVDLAGTLGFLELSLTDGNTAAGDAGFVPLLDRRQAGSPMVQIDLDGGADGRIVLSDLYDDLGSVEAAFSAPTNSFALDGAGDTVLTGTINAAVPQVTLNAKATIGETELGGSELGAATLTFAWPNIFDAAPTVSGDATFNDDFLAFNIDSSNPLALFNSIIDTLDQAIAAIDTIDGDSPDSLLDQDLPVIGTSFRDSVAFLGDVKDTINEIAQNPAASLQRLEAQIELAIAQGLGVDMSAIPPFPNPNDPAFVKAGPDGTLGTGDDFFDEAEFEQKLNDFYAAVETFFAGANDYLTIGYADGNSPGAVTISLKLGVCSQIDADHPGCTKAIPLSKAFNFGLDDVGADLAGLIAAETAGELNLDYNAAVQLDLGVQLPDVANGDFVPRPFIVDTSFVDLQLAGEVNAAFDATLGPFEVKVGNLTPLAEGQSDATQCTNDTDDDGDGFVNDGCGTIGAAAETGDQCTNNTDDDSTDDDTQDGADDDPDAPSVVNDGCEPKAAAVQAEAGAAFHLQADFGGDSAATRVYFLEGNNLTDYVDGIVGAIPGSLTTNANVDCASTHPDGFACASLPLFVNAGGNDIYLGTIDGTITGLSPFSHTFDPNDLTAIKDALLANVETLAWQLIGQGLKEFGAYVEEATAGAAYDVDIPVIGDALDAGADIGAAFNGGFANPIGTFLTDTYNPTDVNSVVQPLRQYIFDQLGPSGVDLLLDVNAPEGVDIDDVTITIQCGDDLHVCANDGDPDNGVADDALYDIRDLSVQLSIGDSLLPDEAAEIPFEFGFPGLRLATADGDGDGDADGVKADVTWSIDLGFGLSLLEGFYLVTGDADAETPDDPEIELEATVNTPDFTADIAFLGIEIDSDNSDTPKPDQRSADELSLGLVIDFPDDEDGRLSLSDFSNVDPKEFLPQLTAAVDLYWPIVTAPEFGGASADNGSMPTLKGILNVTGAATLSVDGLEFTGLAFGFDNIALDLGSFIDDFLAPVLGEVQKFTKPLQPIIDTVSAPIPGISQLAELVGADPVTLLSLFEAVSGNDLTLIRTLIKVITFVNSLPANSDGIADIVIGSFTVDAQKILDTELPANQKSELVQFNPGDVVTSDIGAAIAGANGLANDFKQAFASNLSSADPQEFEAEEPGFTFPAFQDLTQMFNLLVGQDVTLIRFASGPLKAEFGYSQSFGPIAVGPIPVSIVISGSASIEGRFAVGYDTKGVRQLVQMLTDGDSSNDDFLTGFGFLFNGLFLDDLNAAGQDVPEIRLVVEFAAGAAVDLVIVSAGVEGGVRATLDLNLHDGGFFEPIPPANLDGKLRLDEVASFLFGNPICLFDVSGKLEAFIRIFVEIDLFLFSARFEFTVINITLLELDNITKELCQPPPPVLAKDIGDGVLRLNMGPNAGERNYAPDTLNEKFTVKQIADHAVEVSAFGLIQTYGPNPAGQKVYDFNVTVNKVVADAGTDKDTIRFDPGTVESIATGDIPGTQIVEQAGDVVSQEIPFVLPTIVCGGPSDDKVYGGEGVDTVFGDSAQNGAGGGNGWACTGGETGTDGADQISGLGGADVLNGGGLNDLLSGDDENDTINGGTGDDTISGGVGADMLNGEGGNDTIKGGADRDPALPAVPDDESNDTIDGGTENDTIDGDFGDDTINGGAGDDVIVGGPGADGVHGDGDQDRIFGHDGDDDLFGDAGDDIVFGMVGNDDIRGGDDDDNLIGNEGDDDIEGGNAKDVIVGDMGEINRAPKPGESALDPDPGKPLVSLTPSTGGSGDTNLSGDGDADVIWGQEGDDFIEGGAGDDELHGNEGADTVSGDADADTMFGDAGTDSMYGDNSAASNDCSDGIDTIKGGDDADTISGNAQGDSLFGDNGDDTVYGDADTPNAPCDGIDTIYGGPLDDYAFGNATGDAINGQGGVDRLVGGGDDFGAVDGGDVIDGGTEADVIAGDNATIADAAQATGMLVTLHLDDQGDGDDLFGQSGPDRIYGQRGADDVVAGSDDDAVEGNEGVDTIWGGSGDDDLVGGSSAIDGLIDTDRVGTARSDEGDEIHGEAGIDFIAGDNALVNRNLPAAGRASVELFDLATTAAAAAGGSFGDDELFGDGQADQIFGQGGADVISGGDHDDYVEGNDGDDTISGNDGGDDLVGGGSANDGKIDVDRVGETLSDVGETLIAGGEGEDYIAGDNALMDRNIPIGAPAPIRLFDVETVATGAKPGTGGGELLITGDNGPDWIFGQTGDDTISGGAGDDYVEGNNGVDVITGDAGDDDLVGGGSANDGVIDDDRVGDGLLDQGENPIDGGTDDDWITGDNALVNRNRPAAGRAPIELFDVQRAGGPVISPLTSGGDVLLGADGDDMVFGQGNGNQPSTETDPDDARNNDFVGTLATDPDFQRITGTVDEDAAAWSGDSIFGGVGDDYIEGNHGNDLIFGNGTAGVGDDEDDITGGGSANDGKIDADRLGLGAALLDGFDTIHGDSGDNSVGDDDAIVGDNAWIRRPGTRQVGPTGPDGAAVDLADRNTQMTTVKAGPNTFANDFVSGNGGHDELFGQQGDDYLEGGWGSDAMVGDLGKVTTDLFTDASGNAACGTARIIKPNEPFVQDPVCQLGTLFRLVELYAYDDTVTTGNSAVAAGNDVMLGLDGDDWMHGGAGRDLMNGDGDGLGEVVDPAHTYTFVITDPNASSADVDRIFGGDSNGAGTVSAVTGGNGDAVWGGRGHDHTYGGRGDDMLEVRPSVANPTNFPAEWSAWAEADVESYHGIDFVYGGYDQDAMQANVADNGPVNGDRLFDWVGVYNIYYLCPATYGAYVSIRDQSPAILTYFETQARTDGALNPQTKGTSGYNELALVYKPDVKNNSHPIYPGTPGHFFCGS